MHLKICGDIAPATCERRNRADIEFRLAHCISQRYTFNVAALENLWIEASRIAALPM